MVETHESKEVPIHSNTTIVIRSKLPRQRGTSLVNNSREQSIAPKAKPRTAWRVLCEVRVRIVYAHANFLLADGCFCAMKNRFRKLRIVNDAGNGHRPHHSRYCHERPLPSHFRLPFSS